MESPTFIKQQIEKTYDQCERNSNDEDEQERIYREKLRIINKKIKNLKNEKKQLKLDFEDSQNLFYKCNLQIRNTLNSLYKKI